MSPSVAPLVVAALVLWSPYNIHTSASPLLQQQQPIAIISGYHVDIETCSGLVFGNRTRQLPLCAVFFGSLANLSASLVRTSDALGRSGGTRLRMAVDAGVGWVCPQTMPCTPPYCGCFNVTWNGQEKSVAEHVVDLSDEVVLMDYTTTVAGVYRNARPYLDIADAHPSARRVRVGVAINNPGAAKNAWETPDEVALAALLTAAEPMMRRHRSFAGFSVYGAWWHLSSQLKPAPPTTVWPAGTGMWYSNHSMITDPDTTARDSWLAWAKVRSIDEMYIAPHATSDALISNPGRAGSVANDARFCEVCEAGGEARVAGAASLGPDARPRLAPQLQRGSRRGGG
jgi:hypothetical protein